MHREIEDSRHKNNKLTLHFYSNLSRPKKWFLCYGGYGF